MRVTAGTDILKINRIFSGVLNMDDPFIMRAFTEGERRQGGEREDGTGRKAYFAARFAGKEAVYKAISACDCGFVPRDIEVVDGLSGRPQARITGKTWEALEAYHVETGEALISLDVSLSFEDEYAVGTAAALFDKTF